MPVTTAGGVLLRAFDGHITSGGEFEKRAAFVPVYALPAGTKNLAATDAGLVVYGTSDLSGGLPLGVTYRKLVHADGVTALDRILSFDDYKGLDYVVAQFVDGTVEHFYNGARVQGWNDGRARGGFQVVSGANGDALNALTVGGTNIIAAPVAYTGDPRSMAVAIADAVNNATTSPDFSAIATTYGVVTLVAPAPHASDNGLVIQAYVSGSLTFNPASGATLAGGLDQADTRQPGTYVRTIGSKMYTVSGPDCFFSAVQDPTRWTTDATGAGFIDMSTQAGGSSVLVALAKYQKYVAVFAGRVVQIWFMDSDPTQSQQVQVLNNTGTYAPRSVTQFGDADLFYLDESGLRSLRARDASNAASTTDVGSPIDGLVTAILRGMSIFDRQKIIGAIDPQTGRFWLAVLDTIFVFSFFSGANVSAWTIYKPGFIVEDMIAFGQHLYLRSGDTIYAYGGLGTTAAYDATVAEAWLPYQDGGEPTQEKRFDALDAACEGQWAFSFGADPRNLAMEEIVMRVNGTTYGELDTAAQVRATHVSVRARSEGTGPAKLGAIVIGFGE